MYKHPLSGGENALGIIEIYPYKVVRIAKLVNRARFAQVDGDRIILVSWGFYVNHLKLGGTNLSSNGKHKNWESYILYLGVSFQCHSYILYIGMGNFSFRSSRFSRSQWPWNSMIHRSFLNRDQTDMGGAVGALGELTLSWTLGEGDREMNIYIISLFIYYIYYIVYIYIYAYGYVYMYIWFT